MFGPGYHFEFVFFHKDAHDGVEMECLLARDVGGQVSLMCREIQPFTAEPLNLWLDHTGKISVV